MFSGLDCSVHRNSVAPDQAPKPHRSQDWELVREHNPALLPVGSNTLPHSMASTLPSAQPSFLSSCPLAPLTRTKPARRPGPHGGLARALRSTGNWLRRKEHPQPSPCRIPTSNVTPFLKKGIQNIVHLIMG